MPDRVKAAIRSYGKWLYPGMRVKRWVVVLWGGVLLFSLAVLGWQTHSAIGYAWVVYLEKRVQGAWAWPLFVAFCALSGVALIGLGVVQLNRSLLAAFRRPDQAHVVDVVYEHRRRREGPKIVAIGGGTGLSTLLRGLKEYSDNITAIVTVADDGGSSGKLREQLGVLPPGDFRNCIAALANDEALITRLFQYRFGEGEGLNGHSFGNLFIAAMTAITGSFDRALLESSRVLAVRGRVLPSTLESVVLCADVREERVGAEPRWQRIRGESLIPLKAQGRIIERVFLLPDSPRAYPEAVKAILDADMIVAGPGSLFTSVLPNLLVPDIVEAIRASRALKVYVCNVATQRGETDGFGVHDHVMALQAHVGPGLFPIVVANARFPDTDPPGEGVSWVHLPGEEAVQAGGYRLVTADLLDLDQPWRHDPRKLARCLLDLERDARVNSPGNNGFAGYGVNSIG